MNKFKAEKSDPLLKKLRRILGFNLKTIGNSFALKKHKFVRGALFLGFLVVISFSLLIFEEQSSKAISTAGQEMIELGLIDDIKSSQELNLDYLQQIPPPLDMAIMDNVRRADRIAARLPENSLLGIPLGYGGPIPVSSEVPPMQLPPGPPGRFVAIGTGNRDRGTISPIKSKNVRDMFSVEKRIGDFGGFSETIPGQQEHLVADASGSFLQARRYYVVDLLVKDRLTGQRFMIYDTLMSSLCRNSLNAFLTDRFYLLPN